MPPTSADKWRYTLYTTLVLLILFHPWTYQFMHRAVSSSLASRDGCPTLVGFLVHAAIFTVIVRYMMDLHL